MDNLRPKKHERNSVDRRDILDRRRYYDIEIMNKIGHERRKPSFERREKEEQRKDWKRITKWSSVLVPVISA